MPDFLIRDIDPRIAERVKVIARDKGWPINDVLRMLLRQALGLEAVEPAPEPGDIARLASSWENKESSAFDEAIKALEDLPGHTSF